MEPKAQQFIESLRVRLTAAMDQVGQATEDQTKADIGDLFPPASEPGTPPHRRTGNLQDGVSHSVSVHNESQIRLTVVSERAGGDSMVPVYLEYGTARLQARPFMAPRMDALAHEGLRQIADALQKPLPQ